MPKIKAPVKGYKVFEPDWTCRGFQYTCPGTFKEDVRPSCCSAGFHFCMKPVDCFNYYSFNPENHVAEVIALGDVDTESKDSKVCTNEIQIVREIPWTEVLELVNTGKACTGLCNSGNHNSGNWNIGNWNIGNWNSGDCNSGNYNIGNWNSGNWNSGNCNSGDWNSGDYNSGDCNSGNYNSGDWNSGYYNSGDCNSGDYNSGDYNKTSFSNGCFNTVEPKIYLFNRPSDWTYRDWMNSKARSLLERMDCDHLEWILAEDMTDAEKAAHPEHETTGGYLREVAVSENSMNWWRKLSQDERDVILNLPNFDKAIFKEITGVDVDGI